MRGKDRTSRVTQTQPLNLKWTQPPLLMKTLEYFPSKPEHRKIDAKGRSFPTDLKLRKNQVLMKAWIVPLILYVADAHVRYETARYFFFLQVNRVIDAAE